MGCTTITPIRGIPNQPMKPHSHTSSTSEYQLATPYCPDSIYSQYIKSKFLKKYKKVPKSQRRIYRKRALKEAFEKITTPSKDYMAELPLKNTGGVLPWIRYFNSERGKAEFIRWLLRGSELSPQISPILREVGLPKEMIFLAMIESGFNNAAYSRARAAGTWQFITPTAKAYGLKINYWVDERRNPFKSTRAASHYLKDLYKKFGNWNLSLAAYNAGPGRIRRAIRRGYTKDYWRLSHKKILNRETRNYIPKMTASYLMTRHSPKFGFQIHNPLRKPVELTSIKLSRPIRLRDLARETNIPFLDLKLWNYELSRNVTPPKSPYNLIIPESIKNNFNQYLAKIENIEVQDIQLHSVKKGETLFGLARRYKVKVKNIISVNPTLSPNKLKIGKKIAIPIPKVITRF